MTEFKEISGLKENTIKALKQLGINNIEELITYYPFRYEIYEKTDINKIKDGERVVIDGICENIPNVFFFNKKLNKMSFRLNIGDRILNIIIFNRSYLKKYIKPPMGITVIGKYDKKHNNISASNIILGLLKETIIEPIYHQSFKINSKKINKIINSLIDKTEIKDYVPVDLNRKYQFIDKTKALHLIHKPSDVSSISKAIEKLKYEELFLFMLKINTLKQKSKINNGIERKVDYLEVQKFIEKLPFKLTNDQIKSIEIIFDDLITNKRMNRLLQGDVGSGKTIVAIIALYINYLAGYQGALMAPTEILALQHYNNIKKLLPNIKVTLLTGNLKVKSRREALNNIKNDSNIIIGTHVLFSEDVIYKNLGLVITDEQHHFGVNQRSNLKDKGIAPDVLYMSATPIPRTYALTLYGDMDISNIKTMPMGRTPIKTYLKTSKDIKEVLHMMLDELKKKHQIYVIAPLIEESEKIDLENVFELEEKMKKAFGKLFNVSLLHGKMSSNEKDEIMDKFKKNEIQILISTTVIEVGVDIKNATMMVIFDSFRFGLSALHQLRGRVGRNDLQSYCILISDKETKRLSILTETSDGFKISEEDFKLRGSGDLFGLRQSGDMNFKLVDVKNDYEMLLRAKKDAKSFLASQDFVNSNNAHIRKIVENTGFLD